MEAETSIGLIMAAEDGGHHGSGHCGLENEDALKGKRHGDEAHNGPEEEGQEGESGEEGNGKRAWGDAFRGALAEQVNEGCASEEEGYGDGGLAEKVEGFSEESGEPFIGVKEVEDAGTNNGDGGDV